MRPARETLTEQYAAFSAQLTLQDIPPPSLERLKLFVLDQIGVEIAGSGLTRPMMVRSYANRFGKQGSARVVGTEERLDAEHAALVNGTAGHGLEFDDFCARVPCHPACVVVPATLAVGDELEANGKDVLVALALGFELVTRIGLAATPTMLSGRGFHETCAQGVFGSAISASRLAKLSKDDTVMSLGLAASHASGIDEFVYTGGEVKRLHAGMGASSGIRCMRLAELGMTAPVTALEGRRGFFHAFSDSPMPNEVVEDLGSTWQFQSLFLREFPIAGGMTPGIKALLGIMDDERITARDIVSIQIGKESRRAIGDDWNVPTDLISAQFSWHFVLALAAVRRRVEFADILALEAVGFRDPDIESVARLITIVADEESDRAYPGAFEVSVTVTASGGRQWTRRAAMTAGETPDEQMMRKKFMTIVSTYYSVARADEIACTIDELETLANIRDLTELLGAPAT